MSDVFNVFIMRSFLTFRMWRSPWREWGTAVEGQFLRGPPWDGGTLKKGAALNPKKGEWLGFMVDDVDDVDVLSRVGCQIHLGEN